MEKWIRRSEKGQVFLILMIGVTALLAFTALAIDSGIYFSDRRYDQNVADGSALAGAGAAAQTLSADYITISNFNCTHDENYVYSDAHIQAAVDAAIAEAQSRAFANHFDTLPAFDTEAHLIASGHGVWVDCVEAGDPHLAVHVMVTTDVHTAFTHMFFSSELRNTVVAVSIAEGGIGLGGGMAIVALEKDGCGGQEGGLFFGGSTPPYDEPKVTIIGSGAHSNSCLVCEGANVTIDSDGPLTYNSDDDTKCKEGSILDAPVTSPGPEIDAPPLEVNCGDGDYLSVSNVTQGNTLRLPPGNYKGITVNGGGSLILEPGLYCVEGAISISGGAIVEHDLLDVTFLDDGVTIYSQSGDITINGSAEVNLVAPRSDPIGDVTPASLGDARPTIPGTLIYSDATANKVITLNGNETTIFRGTIYYPYGEVKIVGNSSNAKWYVEVIANKISVSGNSTVKITYDPSNGHPGFSSLTLEQ